MKLFKPFLVIIVSVAAVLVMQRYFGRSDAAPRLRPGGDNLVVTETVSLRHFSNRIEAIGTARANEAIAITASVTERVDRILFAEGAVVKAGDVLVQLEDAQERASFAEAKINLAEKEREFKRIQDLRQKMIVSEKEYDAQESAFKAAEARRAAAEAVLQDRTIKAPFGGVLGIRQVSPGALVTPGTVITTLDDLSVIKGEFTVPETYLAELQAGQEVEARSIVWPGEVFRGTVAIIDSRIDTTTRAVAVQARIPNPDLRLRAGMLLTIELISQPRDSVGIPEKALLAYADQQYAFVLRDDGEHVSRREVRLGRRDAGWVEVLDGLKPGETLVTDGLMELKDGSKVKLRKKAESAASQPAQLPR